MNMTTDKQTAMNTITRERAEKIIEAADEVITALAGTNEDVHPDDSTKMCRLWDDLNDRHAPPSVVRELARIALAGMDTVPFMYGIEEPDGTAYMDECCVGNKAASIEDVVMCLNDGLDDDQIPYTIVPLFKSPQLPIQKDLQNCSHLLPIGELRKRLNEQTGEEWVSTKDLDHGKWVKCSYRMPERGRDVLVLDAGGNKFICSHENGFWRDFRVGHLRHEIIRWMELPAAPRQEDE